MAVFFRVGSIIPVFDKEYVKKARSTEDLVGENLRITLWVIPGFSNANLNYKGSLYLDDFRTHQYLNNEFVEFSIEVHES